MNKITLIASAIALTLSTLTSQAQTLKTPAPSSSQTIKQGFGLGDTYWPLILPFLTGGGFFNIFLIRQFLMTIPIELDEAAAIDGASRMRILWTILVPSIKPAIVVVAMMLFIQIWNDLLQQIIYINIIGKKAS